MTTLLESSLAELLQRQRESSKNEREGFDAQLLSAVENKGFRCPLQHLEWRYSLPLKRSFFLRKLCLNHGSKMANKSQFSYLELRHLAFSRSLPPVFLKCSSSFILTINNNSVKVLSASSFVTSAKNSVLTDTIFLPKVSLGIENTYSSSSRTTSYLDLTNCQIWTCVDSCSPWL